jgi:hypothetical protein
MYHVGRFFHSTSSLTYVLQTDEATMKVAEISGEEIDPGTKIEVLKHETRGTVEKPPNMIHPSPSVFSLTYKLS